MSRIKIPDGAGWVVAGLLAVVLVLPSAVTGATAVLTYTGIEGATGGTHANVTHAGQLEVSSASPSQMFVQAETGLKAGIPKQVFPPSGDALIITSVNFWGNSSCSYSLFIYVHGIKTTIDSATCTPTGTVFPFDPGLVIVSGQALYILGYGSVSATVVGYTVPKSAG
jgi:hypothetical protein